MSESRAVEPVTRLVLLRHGQSFWNKKRRFTGWGDIALTPQGETEARNAGILLKKSGFVFDACYCSELKRARDTLAWVQQVMDLKHVPVYRDWRLNERHYGALEGMRPWAAVLKYGIRPVLRTQIDFDGIPPLMLPTDSRAPVKKQQYATVDQMQLPLGESLRQAMQRMESLWQEKILADIRQGKRLLIVSHQGILKTLMMRLEGMTGAQTMRLSIATATPLCYELDQALKPVKRYYLSDTES